MKKVGYLLVILITLFVFSKVNALEEDLYNVLKNEAEANGLARKFTGTHHDSFVDEPTKAIYYWYAENDEEGTQITDMNNVVFAGYCWKMIRTTDTGGVKLMYNAGFTNGKCNSSIRTGLAGKYNKEFNLLSQIGYMYNPKYDLVIDDYDGTLSSSIFGNSVVYSNGEYSLVDTRTGSDVNHHYTCAHRTNTTCSGVYYYYQIYNISYAVHLKNGYTIESFIQDSLMADDVNKTDSYVKNTVDSWYETNLLDYASYLEDTVFCDDRSIYDYRGFNPNGGSTHYSNSSLVFNNSMNANTDVSLTCSNITDKFSIYNEKAKLKYPVGLITTSELKLFNNNNARKSFGWHWLLNPAQFGEYTAVSMLTDDGRISGTNVYYSDGISANPAISLKPGTKYISGSGTSTDPYIVKEISSYDITFNNDNTKGSLVMNEENPVEENQTVTIQVTPVEGYLVGELSIVDEVGNTVSYELNNGVCSFVMPSSAVTITTTYEKVKNSINVEIVNETESISINLVDLTQVEYGEEVNFTITPIKGYMLKDVRVVDEQNNVIDLISFGDNQYTFVMGALNVYIIPSYERVYNSITIEDNENTKEFMIDVNDASVVVYEETVKFSLIPNDGYEVDHIGIFDQNNNNIPYLKTFNKYEYQFVMPDTAVLIKPEYKKIIINNESETIINPNTKDGIVVLIVLTVISFVFAKYSYRKKLDNEF